MTISSNFQFLRPSSVEQAYDYLGSIEETHILAGGTDLIPHMKYGLKRPQYLMALDQIDYLSQIEIRPEGLFIGAMTTLSTLDENPLISKHCQVIGETARLIASPQIRNVGVIGGNILQERRCMFYNQTEFWRSSLPPCYKIHGEVCHQVLRSTSCRAIYYSDLAPLLIALDAKAECYVDSRYSYISVQKVIHGQTFDNDGSQNSNILVTGFLIPHLPKTTWVKSIKQSVRASLDFPIINGTMYYQPQINPNQPAQVRLVVGAVSPEPVVLTDTQRLLLEFAADPTRSPNKIIEAAISETNRKSKLIKDTGIAIKARRKAFGTIGRLVEQFIKDVK